MSRILLYLAFLPLSFGQTFAERGEYALLLKGSPVARDTQSRAEWPSRMQTLRKAQSPVLAELKRRNIAVAYESQLLVNAIFVRADRQTASQLSSIPGVAHVQYLPPVTRDLNTALALENVSNAWSALGGAANAGAGIKIGILDTGIDQSHAAFQSSQSVPAGFPKGDANFTNHKVIVARSYVSAIVAQHNGNNGTDRGDDVSARDRTGHGTAIAMIAAGMQNSGPLAAIQGMAPGAFLGNYKIFGSPGVYDFTYDSVVVQALTDAAADGMDIVTLSLNEGDAALAGPLDYDAVNCGGYCDVRAQAVESAVASGLVVVTSAGNDNGSGVKAITLGSIHTPGTAPSAITVGASTNTHVVYNAVHVAGHADVRAIFGDGPHIAAPVSGPLMDAGLACGALPPGSLNGAIALIGRGTCAFSDKINNAQNAGAVAAIIYQSAGLDTIYSSWGAQDTGIPAVMVGSTDGAALKGLGAATAALDPALTMSGGTQNQVAAFSSRGPAIGMFSSPAVCLAAGKCPVLALKPELVAVGSGLYTAAQKFDPNGDTYNATGYAGVSGTSFAVPMVAGAVAMVKQKFPKLTPSQLKSAVVNTATQDVSDFDGSLAGVNAVGAGKLSVADAINIAATAEPATLGFGVVSQSALPIRLSLTVTNVSSSQATFNIAVQPGGTSSASVVVTPSSLNLQAGGFTVVAVTLQGTQPAAGSYEGFLTVTGAGSTLRVPYEYIVLSTPQVPTDLFPVLNGSFLAGAGDSESNNAAPFIAFRLADQFGAPILNTPATFSIAGGSASFGTSVDPHTFNYGEAGADLNAGNQAGSFAVTASAGGLSYIFNGYVRPYPAIGTNGVVDAATFQIGGGFAAGSYVSIFGTALADATEHAPTIPLPVSLSYGSVSFSGAGLSVPGRLLYVSPTQINVQVPWEFQGQKSVQMTVWSNYLPSASYTVPLAQYSPGLYAVIDATQGTAVTQSSPAKRGDTLTLWASGLGPVSNQPASGDAGPGVTLAQTPTLPTVTLGGVKLNVSFSGLAPGYVGLYQVNADIPANAPTGNQQLIIGIGGVNSPATNVAVQ